MAVRKTSPKPKAQTHDRKSQLDQALTRIRGLESQMAAVIRGMQEKVRHLECLNEFSSLMNSTFDPSEVREKALEATCRLLGCETASLLLIDPKTAELYWDTALGEAGKELQRTVRLPIDNRSIAGYVAMTGESVFLNDVQSDPRYNRAVEKKTGFVTRTMLCVPLKSRDRVIGVLQAINKIPGIYPTETSKRRWPEFHPDDFRLLDTLSHQVAIAMENAQLYSRLKRNFYETVEALVEAIEKKDRYTGGHTKRVVHYSLCIAKHMNLAESELERIRLGAILHDVGKIGIEDRILKKEAPLDTEEWRVMQKHPQLGYEIMSRVEGLRDVISGMRYHHERWDGLGYPLGLKGEEIPLLARIIAVADTYDAMVSTRPYRKGLDARVAFQEIIAHRGTQFDPRVVDAFAEAFHQERMGRGKATSIGKLSNCD